MAAQEYYLGTAAAQQQQQQQQQQAYSYPYQQQPPLSSGQLQPAYSPIPQPQQQTPPYPQEQTPYLQPQQYLRPSGQQYLAPPVQPIRSHSEPPEDQREYLNDQDRGRDRDRGHHHRHHDGKRHSSRSHSRSGHKDRDTFLGAGGGAIIGDAIFPGLGTAAGLLLGGYGGRKHAEKRSKSELDTGRRRKDGWDEKTATYKKGWAVR